MNTPASPSGLTPEQAQSLARARSLIERSRTFMRSIGVDAAELKKLMASARLPASSLQRARRLVDEARHAAVGGNNANAKAPSHSTLPRGRQPV